MIFKVLAKMKIFQIWAKIDDFFKFLAKMMIFQNLVKIDGFSNFNFLCHLKFSNSSQCGMLWCGVVQTTLLWCGVELIPHHTFRQSSYDVCASVFRKKLCKKIFSYFLKFRISSYFSYHILQICTNFFSFVHSTVILITTFVLR